MTQPVVEPLPLTPADPPPPSAQPDLAVLVVGGRGVWARRALCPALAACPGVVADSLDVQRDQLGDGEKK